MQKYHNHRRFLRLTALAAFMLVFMAGPCTAKEWEMVNTPPPMPPGIQGHTPSNNGTLLTLPANTVRVTHANEAGIVAAPGADNGHIWAPASLRNAAYGMADARELKLKAREMASQLIADMDVSLRGVVALPTSFVNQEDFSQSSPFGRFMAEQMLYEFNQRGFPVKEYRLANTLAVKEGQGEFLLSRKVGSISAKTPGTVFVVGTYFQDRNAVFVNARLVRGNGEVLRTAQVMLPGSAMTRRMLVGADRVLPKGRLPIQDYKITTQPTNLTPFDLGADIH